MKKCIRLVFIVFVFSACGGGKSAVSKKKDNYVVNKYAEILKTPKSEIKNVKLYSFIDSWYGVKYRFGGMSKSGVDCSGFCNVLYSQVYNRQIRRTTAQLVKDVNKVGKNRLKEGDLVFFNIARKKNSHVGVYLKNNKFVHASSSKGVIISSLENPYYKKAYNKGGRF
ncbi:MAG: NlpC/P60 family protein [Vicingaceae bacterium]|nr:NlpC/P60 family protein [Vicingaceae bacterium]